MISYLGYKVIHLAGIFLVLLSQGTLIAAGEDAARSRWRKIGAITNGIGLAVALVAGFGLIARLQLSWPWPGWVFIKLLIWLAFGVLMALASRLPRAGQLLWWGSFALAAAAAYLANYKPI